MTYRPRIADQLLALRVNAGIGALAEHPRFADASPDLIEAFVTGIGEFAADEFAPLNRPGDTEGAVAERGSVRLRQRSPAPTVLMSTRAGMRPRRRPPSADKVCPSRSPAACWKTSARPTVADYFTTAIVSEALGLATQVRLGSGHLNALSAQRLALT